MSEEEQPQQQTPATPEVQPRSQPPPSTPSGLVEEPSEGTQQAN
jgi:hypothetical protein